MGYGLTNLFTDLNIVMKITKKDDFSLVGCMGLKYILSNADFLTVTILLILNWSGFLRFKLIQYQKG